MAPFPSSSVTSNHTWRFDHSTAFLFFPFCFIYEDIQNLVAANLIKVRFFIPPSLFNTFAITLNWYENKALKEWNINLWKNTILLQNNWFFQEIFHSYVNILERVQKPWQKMLIIWIMFWQPLTFNNTH